MPSALSPRSPSRREQVLPRPGVACSDEVVGAALALGEEDQRHRQPLAGEHLQVGQLHRLHDDGRAHLVEAMGSQCLEHQRLQLDAECREVGRVLDLGGDRDGASEVLGELLPQVQDLLEGGHEVLAVVGRALGALSRLGFACPQRAQLGQGEVLGEPVGHRDPVHDLGRAAVRELRVVGHVRRVAEEVLVAHDQDAVTGGDEVRLDDVGAQLRPERIGRQGVLRQVARGAAVGDHERLGPQPGRRRVAATRPAAVVAHPPSRTALASTATTARTSPGPYGGVAAAGTWSRT